METKKSYYPWVIVFTCLAWSGFIFGLMGNTIGLFYAPVMKEMGWTMTQTSFFMTIFPIVAAVTSPFAGKIYAKVTNIQYILAGISILWSLAFVWSSTFTMQWQWNVYGVISGIFGGFMMYIPVPMLINNWFTKRKGIALGFAAAFVNIVPAICNPIITAQMAVYGWRTVRVALAIISFFLATPITLWLVRKSPAQKGLKPYGADDESIKAPKDVEAVTVGVTSARAMKSPAFYLCWVMAFCIVACASMNQRIAGFAAAKEFDAVAIGLASSFIMYGGIFGKFILGFIRDRTNAVTTGLVCAGFGILGSVMVLTIGTTGSAIVFFISILIYGFGYAGLTVVPPIVVESAFGSKNFGQIYANVTIVTCLASSIASLVYAQIVDRTGGYEGCFVFTIFLYAIFGLCVPFIIKFGKKLPRESQTAV